jgi:hypothetical protein
MLYKFMILKQLKTSCCSDRSNSQKGLNSITYTSKVRLQKALFPWCFVGQADTIFTRLGKTSRASDMLCRFSKMPFRFNQAL